MKIIKFLFITLWFLTGTSFYKIKQNSNELDKYSYDLFGYTVANKNILIPAGGSCFFIRKDSRLFLITAAHVINGCDDSGKIRSNYPSKFSVLEISEKGYPTTLASINVIHLQQTLKCPAYPDIAVIEVSSTDSKLDKINSVESFIKPPFKQTGNLYMAGFPSIKNPTNDLEHLVRVKKSLVIENKREIFYGDSIAIGFPQDSVFADTMLNGFSGSPIFVQEKNSNNFRILGVYTETVTNTKIHKSVFGAMRIEQVMDSINSLVNLKK